MPEKAFNKLTGDHSTTAMLKDDEDSDSDWGLEDPSESTYDTDKRNSKKSIAKTGR